MSGPSRLLAVCAIALAGFAAVLQLSRWPGRLAYPGEEDFVEGTQLAEMLHLREGIRIYDPPVAGRFDGAIYGPFFYLIGARIVDPGEPAYRPLRILSLVATVGVAAECAVFVFWLGQSGFAAALAPLLFVSCAFVGRYGISARGDMVSLFLAFAGFLVAFRFRYSRALLLAVPLMLLSLFYKQEFLAGPLAVGLFLLWERRYRLAVEFAGMMAAGVATLLALFSWVVFPHQAFLQHLLAYNALPFDGNALLTALLAFALALLVPFVGTLSFLRRHPDRLVALYTGFAVVVYVLVGSRAGADTNRCLECVVVFSCLLAAQVATARSLNAAAAWTGALSLALFLNFLISWPKPNPTDFDQDRALQNYLRQNFSPRAPALGYYVGDLVRAGLDVPITNLWHYSQLLRTGAFSDRDVLAHLRERRYAVILLDFDLEHPMSEKAADFYTTESMRNAILDRYQLSAILSLPRPEKVGLGDDQIYAWLPRPDGKRNAERIGDPSR